MVIDDATDTNLKCEGGDFIRYMHTILNHPAFFFSVWSNLDKKKDLGIFIFMHNYIWGAGKMKIS